MSNRHLGTLIIAMYVVFAAALAVGMTVQAHNEAARRHIAISESQERTQQVCGAENETRQALRELATHLTSNPHTLAVVNRDLADKDCNAIAHNKGDH